MSLFRLSLTLKNKIGIMKTISETLFSMEINIDELHTKKISNSETNLIIGLEIPDYEFLIVDRFMERIKGLLGKDLISFRIQEIDNK